MKVSEQISKSIGGSLKGFSLISKAGLNWIYLLPFAVYILVFVFGFSLTNDFHGALMEYIEGHMETWIAEYSFLDSIMTISSVVFWIIIKLMLFVIFGIISGYITLIVLSPVYAWISEKMEEEIRKVRYRFNLAKFTKDILRAVIIALRNSLIQLIWTILLFILSFIPVVNLITTPLLFIITAYFYGFSFLDYSYERKGLSMGASIKEVRSMKFAAFCLGGIFLLLYMIPFIGALLASIISFHLVVSSTLLVLNNNDDSSYNRINP